MTQVIGGSVETDPINSGINLIASVVDEWTELARELDPTQRLRVAIALGQIASGVLMTQEILHPGEKNSLAHTPDLALVPQPILDTSHDSVAPTNEDSYGKPDILDEVTEATEANVLDVGTSDFEKSPSEESVIDKIEQYFSELKLSPREAMMMEKLCAKTGIPVRASDIYEGLEGSIGGLKQGFTSFMHKIMASPYSEYLTRTGVTSTTRYVWEGHGFEFDQLKDTPSPSGQADVPPLEMFEDKELVIERESSSEISNPLAALKILGLDLNQIGNQRFITLRGVELKGLHAFDTEVLIRIANHNGRTYFKELANDEALKQLGGTNIARDLNESLQRIANVLQHHDIHWRDANIHMDGVKKRKIELGFPAPSAPDKAEKDFLAPGP